MLAIARKGQAEDVPDIAPQGCLLSTSTIQDLNKGRAFLFHSQLHKRDKDHMEKTQQTSEILLVEVQSRAKAESWFDLHPSTLHSRRMQFVPR
jgi:hypothetical protein